MNFNFSKSRTFAESFAWHESNNGRRVKLSNVRGSWIVTVSRDNGRRIAAEQINLNGSI